MLSDKIQAGTGNLSRHLKLKHSDKITVDVGERYVSIDRVNIDFQKF